MELMEKLKTMRVLFIDDHDWIRSAMEYFFRKKMLAFVALENAEMALEHLKNEAYDIIICDYKLPGINGLEFFNLLEERFPGVIKILITAYASTEIAIEADKIGVHDFIQKPFRVATIERSLTRLIQEREEKHRSASTTQSATDTIAKGWDDERG